MGFIDDFHHLTVNLPRPPINSMDNENSPFVNGIHRIKNCYFCFDGGLAEDCAYCYFPYETKDCFDCDYTFESELCYECTDCQKCYTCGYSDDCHSCRDLQFCSSCHNCHDCVGCVGLRYQEYCIFNQKLSKKDYEKNLAGVKKMPVNDIRRRVDEMKKTYPRPSIHSLKSDNCPYGNFITNCSNSYWIFDGIGDEECAYLVQSKFCKDSFDLHQSYRNELCYEGHTSMSYASSHVENCSFLVNCHYMFNCNHCKECWGCAHLSNASYCILNRQYSKDDFQKKVTEIKKELGWPLTSLPT